MGLVKVNSRRTPFWSSNSQTNVRLEPLLEACVRDRLREAQAGSPTHSKRLDFNAGET